MSFRTDNEPFKAAMQGFTQKIVEMMKAENLFESQGGPIILSQIENEYGAQGKSLGPPRKAYMNWAAKMEVGLNTCVPWSMCKEEDAPDPMVRSNPLISFLSFRAGYPCTSMLTGLHLVWQLRTLTLACLSLFKVL